MALPIILDEYQLRGSGPNGGSAHRLSLFLDRWKGHPVRVLVDCDETHVIVVPANALLEEVRPT